ncbi:MAG: hypothetical protein IPP29_06310 [Bacteroidetes bacterium]|nr:hypothetical protein [Bacteroidota bacterium]
MLNRKKASVIYIALVLLYGGCKQSAPTDVVVADEKGDLTFSGYNWKYKNALTPVGPGPNRFLGTAENAWVDNAGSLHMRISKKNNFWYCSEIISVKEFGYGTYVFTCENDIRNLNEKNVFGFFTWDDYSFQKEGNSEVDIEFSKWNNPNDTLVLTYSVQPVIFQNPVPYSERTYKPPIATSLISKATTHMMRWTPDSVYWESYEGEFYPGPNKIASWSFDKNNIPRSKLENNLVSDPIVIPGPGDSTNLRFNYWLLNGQPPTNGLEYEMVIKSFKYFPL